MVNAKKKVCILRSNPVNPDSRVEKEAWTLKKNGYDVHILAWDRSSNEKEVEGLVKVSEEEIPITRLGYKATYGEGLKNLKAYLFFQFHMRKWLKKNDFDVIHACDFDTAFFSIGIAKRKKEKFIFDIFDFLFDSPKNLLQKVIKLAQYSIINRADATIICTEERKEQIKGSKPRQIVVIHNTPSLMQVNNEVSTSKQTEKTKIVYVGILQDYRLLKEMIHAVELMNDVELHIGGFGKFEDYIINESKSNDNIIYHGKLTYQKTLELENTCDIMTAIYDPCISNHIYAAPNKFYEGLMLGKPLIMVKGTGMSNFIQKEDIGELIDFNEESFSAGVRNLINRQAEWEKMGEREKKLYKERFSWAEMEYRLLNLYENID